VQVVRAPLPTKRCLDEVEQVMVARGVERGSIERSAAVVSGAAQPKWVVRAMSAGQAETRRLIYLVREIDTASYCELRLTFEEETCTEDAGGIRRDCRTRPLNDAAAVGRLKALADALEEQFRPKDAQPAVSTEHPTEHCFWDDGQPDASGRDVRADVRRLWTVTDMPYICGDLCRGGSGCGEEAFWRVVRDGRAAIPFLVDSLDDATPVQAHVPNIGGLYTKGVVALDALQSIVRDIPVLDIVAMPRTAACPACTFWNFVRHDPAKRRLLKRKVGEWIEHHNLVWRPSPGRADGRDLGVVDCVHNCPHPAGGIYMVAQP
jgi:hypothetical protein